MRIAGSVGSYDKERDKLCIYRGGDVNKKVLLLNILSATENEVFQAMILNAKKGDFITIEFANDYFWKCFPVKEIKDLHVGDLQVRSEPPSEISERGYKK